LKERPYSLSVRRSILPKGVVFPVPSSTVFVLMLRREGHFIQGLSWKSGTL
jgi:hypothetical protein